MGFLKGPYALTGGRTDNTCENSEHYQPRLWVGLVDQLSRFCILVIAAIEVDFLDKKLFIERKRKSQTFYLGYESGFLHCSWQNRDREAIRSGDKLHCVLSSKGLY